MFNADLTVMLGIGFCRSAYIDGYDLQVSNLRLLGSSINSLRRCWKWRRVWILLSPPPLHSSTESFVDLFL